MSARTNRILRVNLSSGQRTVEELDPEVAGRFLGGRGLAAHIVASEVAAGAHPFEAENKVVVAPGLLTGAGAVGSSRWCVATKSPMGGLACSVLGGHFGAGLRFAGYDAIIIEGQAAEPSYLNVRDGSVTVAVGLHLWGRTVHQAEELIRSEAGDAWKSSETRIFGIGPAGEKLSAVATVVADGYGFGQGDGLASVMASKKLKAIAVRGTRGLPVADGEAFRNAISHVIDRIRRSSLVSDVLSPLGTAPMIEAAGSQGTLGVRHFQSSVLEGSAALGGQAIAASILTRGLGCFGCPIACGRLTRIPTADSTAVGEGPDHAALGALGALCGVADLQAVTRASYLCAEQGIDPVSGGSTIACAMELAERGLIPEQDLGPELRFGDAEAVLLQLNRMAQRRRSGEILADGPSALAERYGQPELFMGVKGRAAAPYDPRGDDALGLWYATANHGPGRIEGTPLASRLLRGSKEAPASEEVASSVIERQDMEAFFDSLGVCPLAAIALPLEDTLRVANAATGLELSPELARQIGERVVNLERRFNLECGVGQEQDRLPRRWLEEPMPDGPAQGRVCSLGQMLPQYYQMRGWDETGVPRPEKLSELKL
jgi:aldehyde:ferredoxin oxidoreductase